MGKKIEIDIDKLVRAAFKDDEIIGMADGVMDGGDVEWTNTLMDALENKFNLETEANEAIQRIARKIRKNVEGQRIPGIEILVMRSGPGLDIGNGTGALITVGGRVMLKLKIRELLTTCYKLWPKCYSHTGFNVTLSSEPLEGDYVVTLEAQNRYAGRVWYGGSGKFAGSVPYKAVELYRSECKPIKFWPPHDNIWARVVPHVKGK